MKQLEGSEAQRMCLFTEICFSDVGPEGGCFFFIEVLVYLQSHASFRCAAKQFNYISNKYILFSDFFRYGSLQDIEYNSLYNTVGPCCLPVLYKVVRVC